MTSLKAILSYHVDNGGYEQATYNQRIALSAEVKQPYTYRADKSYLDFMLSVSTG